MIAQNSDMNSTAPKTGSSTLRASLVVAGASAAFFTTVGFINAFGVFQQYFKTGMLADKSDSDISWIGSVCIFFLYALAPVAGVLVDRIGPTVSSLHFPGPKASHPNRRKMES
jgi:MFS family permease